MRATAVIRICTGLHRLTASRDVPVEIWQWSRSQALWTGLGIGAGVTGLVAMIKNKDQEPGLNGLMIGSWVILAVACLGTALVRRYRSRRPQA